MTVNKGTGALQKAIDLITLLETHRELGLSEATKLSKMPKGTVARLLGALTEAGFVRRTAERRYRLGLRLLQLGAVVAESLDVRRIALPHMRLLRDQCGQSVQLVIRDGDEGVYVERVEGTSPVRLYLAVGRRAPLYAGASTRLLLAYCSPEDQAEILAANPPVAHTPLTITDPVALQQSLAETRRQGWALSGGELQVGSAELAAPVYDHAGHVIAALSIAGAVHQYEPQHVATYLPLLRQAAAAISREMGYQQTG